MRGCCSVGASLKCRWAAGVILIHATSQAFVFNGMHKPSRPCRRSNVAREDGLDFRTSFGKRAEQSSEPWSGWQASWTSVLSLAVTAGLVAGLVSSPANALDEKELKALAEMEAKSAVLDPKDRDRILQYKNEPAPAPVAPRLDPKMNDMTENQRLKAERLARDKALMNSIPLEDGWKMKLWGMPETGPSRKKRKSASQAKSAKADDTTADATSAIIPP